MSGARSARAARSNLVDQAHGGGGQAPVAGDRDAVHARRSLLLLGFELLAQDGVDHGVTPCPVRVRTGALGMVPSSITSPAARRVRADASLEGLRAPPDAVQAQFGEAETVYEPDGLQPLRPWPHWSGRRAKPIVALSCSPAAEPRGSDQFAVFARDREHVLGPRGIGGSGPEIAALTIPAAWSAVRGSKLRCRVASSLP